MGGSPAQGARSGGDGGAQSHQDRQEAEEGVEENGHQSVLCGWRLHPQASKVRALHQTYGKPFLALQKVFELSLADIENVLSR